jgi:tetratricopeptide (TPR) repeat protein
LPAGIGFLFSTGDGVASGSGFFGWLKGRGDKKSTAPSVETPAPEVEGSEAEGPTSEEQAASLGADAMQAAASGDPDRAQSLLEQAIALDPDHPRYHGNRGNLLRALGDLTGALRCYDRVAALRPNMAMVHVHRATTLNGMGLYDAAVQAGSRALKLAPEHPRALLQRAAALRRLGRGDEALADYQAVLVQQPGERQATLSASAIHKAQGRLSQGLALLEKGVAASPDDPDLANNMGTTLLVLGRIDEALAAFAKVVALAPDHAHALQNLASNLLEWRDGVGGTAPAEALVALNRDRPHQDRLLCASLQLAEGHSERALATLHGLLDEHPNDAEAWTNLGVLLLELERYDDALAALTRSADLFQDHGRVPEGTLNVPVHRLRHDLEQVQHLGQQGELTPELRALGEGLGALCARLPPGVASVDLPPAEMAPILASHNRILWKRESPRQPGGVLGPGNDWPAFEEQYRTGSPRMVVIDDFLSPKALAELRRFCRESTIWKTTFPDGYVGATMREGFACPLLFQIADEMRQRMPTLFAGHKLQQSWGFKYDSTLRGVNIHADFAEVNVNFWITEDEANLKPEGSGLIVWDAASPSDWSFDDYNSNTDGIRSFLRESGARSVRVAHRANRALLFDSTYFHETDEIHFRDDYASRRINVTMLFGRRLRRG